MKALKPLLISGREVLPLVEGGKGISISNGESSGAWAASGGVGTFSGVNADSYSEAGELIPQLYSGRTRREHRAFRGHGRHHADTCERDRPAAAARFNRRPLPERGSRRPLRNTLIVPRSS